MRIMLAPARHNRPTLVALCGRALLEESSALPRVLEHRDGDLLADLDLIWIGDIARAGNIGVVVG